MSTKMSKKYYILRSAYDQDVVGAPVLHDTGCVITNLKRRPDRADRIEGLYENLPAPGSSWDRNVVIGVLNDNSSRHRPVKYRVGNGGEWKDMRTSNGEYTTAVATSGAAIIYFKIE